MEKEICLRYGEQRLSLNQLGGGIKEYYLEGKDGRRDLIYGYSNEEEKTASMGDVLFPFPGRVENAEYEFKGEKYKLSGLRIKDGHANHGFAKWAEWEIEEKQENRAKLSFLLEKTEYAGKGYPFSLKITLTYSLGDEGMRCDARIENKGNETAPFGLGFHPYFTVGSENVDEMISNIRARKLVQFDENLKPSGEIVAVEGDLDFNEPKKIGDLAIDNCFTDLEFKNGRVETKISNEKRESVIVWQDENFPYLQVFSADTLDEKHRRKGFAIEPQTCAGYAFNMPELGLRILEPKAAFEGSWGVILNI